MSNRSMIPDLPRTFASPGLHPLAAALVTAVARRSPARAYVLGIGSGRHIDGLLAAGLHVDAVDEDAERARGAAARFASDERVRIVHGSYAIRSPFAATYDAALATHALLHGRAHDVAAAVAATHASLRPHGVFCAALGSTHDPRFGRGRRIDDATFAPHEGDERGVPHVFFDRAGARAVFAGFALDALEETDASAVVGRWAHDDPQAGSIVHWFVRATALARD